MKVAIVDMGSNSIRLLLGAYEGGSWHNESKRLWTTRLGQRLADGTLGVEAMEASYKALGEIQELGRDFGVEETYVLATSAVREAPNGPDFVKSIQERYAMDVRIISGHEEALNGFLGAAGDYLGSGGNYAIIDVGGGSTEIAIGNKGGLLWSHSYLMGAVRFQSLSEKGADAISEYVRPQWLSGPDTISVEDWIGIGGTATTLGAMDLAMEVYDPRAIQGHVMTLPRIESLVADLRMKSLEERRNIPGLQPGRADIIVAGAEVIVAVMKRYGAQRLILSERDGMEGFEAGLCE